MMTQIDEEAFERYQEAMTALVEAMRPISEQIRTAILEFMRALAKAVRPAFERLVEQVYIYVILLRREQLYQSLSNWIPDRLARFVADRCPERWLPELKVEEGQPCGT